MSTNGSPSAGAPPPGDMADLPVLDPQTAPRFGDLVVRPPVGWWDRVKITTLLIGLWWILLWADMTNNPLQQFSDAANHQLRSLWWIEVLVGLELLRQVNYAVCERSQRWYRIWTTGITGSFSRFSHHLGDWTRYRIGRVIRILIVLAIASVLLGAFYHTSPVTALFQVPAALFTALPLLAQLAFAFFFVAFQFIGLFWLLSRGGVDVYFPGDVKTRFSDVWGQDAVLSRVKESIIFLQDPEAIEARGGYVPGGILLWGPPGTGKTLIAEAVAGETHNPFVFVDPGAFINMFMGVGILKVKSLFRKLRKLAVRYGGVVVFFDEADSLGNRGAITSGRFSSDDPSPFASNSCHGLNYLSPEGSTELLRTSMRSSGVENEMPRRRIAGMMGGMMGGGGNGGGMGTLQSLLSELSGLNKPRGFINRVVRRALGFKQKPPPKYRMLVMMATNMPQSLDEALLRPGRIDRIYKVGYPSKPGRIHTYEGYLAKVRHNLTSDDIDKLATITPYATGATIKDLVNEALIIAIREGKDEITWSEIVKAKQLKDLGPPEDVDYIERERHAIALHEACHAVVAARVRRELVIDIATIEKGGNYLGMVSSVRAEETFTRWKTDYEADMMVSLASLAGEKMFFRGDNSGGVSGDLASATHWAAIMEGYLGMGQTIAVHGVTHGIGVGGSGPRNPGREDRDLLNSSLGSRIESKLIDILGRTAELLDRNRLEVLGVTHALECHKTITGEDVLAIIDGRPGPFIDGRRYHTDEFYQQAVAYHEAALMAHDGHGTVSIPLPELPEVPDLAPEPMLADALNGVVTNGLNGAGYLEVVRQRTAP